MNEYVKLKTARKVVCSVCKEFAPPGNCPKDCAWMRRLKENAADVAPMMHGEWEVVDLLTLEHGEIERAPKSALRCSVCSYAFDKGLLGADNFCPHCGARMDGDAHASD